VHCGIAKLLQSATCHVSLSAVADAWEKKMESVGTVAAPAVLLADIGGTNARFSLRVGDALGPVAHLAVAEHPRFIDALGAFLAQHGSGCRITAAILAVAGPTKNGRAELTNSTWIIDGAELAAELGYPVQVVNDFEALARAVPALGPADVVALCRGEPLVDTPRLVLGPGTGLGAACLAPYGDDYVVIATEAGHVTAPSWSTRTDQVIAVMRQRFGHVSAERLLSGSGLENLYQAVIALDGFKAPARSAAEITQAALDASCPASRATLDLFCAMLGEVAGNLALSFGARGGVYVAGGIVPRIADVLARSEFRQRFTDRGRMRAYLEAIPIWLVVCADCTFLGLQAMAARLVAPRSKVAA
jgi:glucokinase